MKKKDSKTINNRTCQIPFTYDGIQQNTCIFLNNRFECATNPNATAFDECSFGSFLLSRPYPDGNSYHAALKIHMGNFTVGSFVAEFYVYTYCYETRCKEAYDYLSVDVVYARNFPQDAQDDELSEVKIVYTHEIVEKNKWIKMTVPFTVEPRGTKQPIFAIQTGRTFRLQQMNYIAIDNLIIKQQKSFAFRPTSFKSLIAILSFLSVLLKLF